MEQLMRTRGLIPGRGHAQVQGRQLTASCDLHLGQSCAKEGSVLRVAALAPGEPNEKEDC